MGLFDIFKKDKKEKVAINDNIFGNLTLIDEGWIKPFEMTLFDNNYDIDLIVENAKMEKKAFLKNKKICI